MIRALGYLVAIALVLTNASFVWARQPQTLGGIEYGMADWPESGFGNHRALVDVAGADGAVRARIPWRRHDANFRGKAVKIGFVGVYLDGIGYDRIDVMRLARTLTSSGSDYYLPFHSGDNFKNPWSERRSAAVAAYTEHLPYVTQLMFGEVFWYNGPEGYWMTNLAGLPFGIDNQSSNMKTPLLRRRAYVPMPCLRVLP